MPSGCCHSTKTVNCAETVKSNVRLKVLHVFIFEQFSPEWLYSKLLSYLKITFIDSNTIYLFQVCFMWMVQIANRWTLFFCKVCFKSTRVCRGMVSPSGLPTQMFLNHSLANSVPLVLSFFWLKYIWSKKSGTEALNRNTGS